MWRFRCICGILFGIALDLTTFAAWCVSPIDPAVYGRWNGEVQISSQKFPIQFEFDSLGNVTVNDGEPKRGTYTMTAHRIDLLLETDGQKYAARIDIEHLDGPRLSGRFSVSGDPSELAGALELRRSDSAPSNIVGQSSLDSCSVPDLPQKLLAVLAQYGVSCPIHIEPPITPEGGVFLSQLFRAILNEVLAPDFSVSYAGDGRFIVRANHSSMSEVEQTLKPMLANPDSVTLEAFKAPCPPGIKCALTIEAVGDLKPYFRNGERVDLFKVWSTAVQVAQQFKLDLIPPNKLPPFSASTNLVPKPPVGPNGIIFERVTLSVEDPYASDKQQSGRYLQIHVKSEIWRKPSFASAKAFKVEDECSAETAMPFDSTCSSAPLLEAILKRIVNPTRGVL